MRNYVVDRLNNYLENGYVLNRVPLLIGPSGIAKSALVKEATKSHNMRLVDIRTAFMSRLDIEGLSEKIWCDGEYYSEASPMLSFIKCTDEYLRVAEQCAIAVEKELETCPDEYKASLQETLSRFREESKTPVLLFDEITRGEASVRQVLTKILTDKEFMGFSMKRARVLAATNFQYDSSGHELEIFSVNNAYDVAFYDRFESIYIGPEVMNDVWLSWAQKNLHKDLLPQINVPYDTQHYDGKDVREATTTPYRCYRTWEMVSKVFEKRDELKLPGDKTNNFISTIIGGTYSLSMTEFLDIAVATNTPALIISPSGMAKTSRVKKLVSDRGYECISINLSEVDRLDLEGMPVKVSLVRAMVGNAKVTRGLAETIREIVKNSQLPSHCTVRAPKKEYADRFKKALETNRKVIIYFDECNRVQNVSVMSAIFSVISDNRLFGIKFDPTNVETILSCNLSDNCLDAQELDPALCARFAIWKTDGYTASEVDSFREYMKQNNFEPVIQSYFNSLSTEKAVQVISSVETRSIDVSAASTRAWEDLSRTLATGTIPFMSGCVIFSSDEIRRQLSEMVRTGNNSDILFGLLYCRYKKWTAHTADDTDTYEEGKSIKQTVQEIGSKLKSATSTQDKVELIKLAWEVDSRILEYRDRFFTMFLGSSCKSFAQYYNNLVGLGTTVSMLTAEMKSSEVAEVARNVINNPIEDTPEEAVVRLLESIPTIGFKDAPKMCRVIWRELTTLNKYSIIQRLAKTIEGNKVLKLYEDRDFYIRIAKELEINIPLIQKRVLV